MIISPLPAVTSLPSRTIVTVSAGGSAIGAGTFLDVDAELVPEHPDGRHDGARDGRAERADRRLPGRPGQTRGDVVAGIEHQVQVGVAPLPRLDALQDLLQPAAALPAGGALAARLDVEEPG